MKKVDKNNKNKSAKFPNSWYVQRFSDIPDIGWMTLVDSVGNKSYATGYFNALDGFHPSPSYRLVNNTKGMTEIEEERNEKQTPNTNNPTIR